MINLLNEYELALGQLPVEPDSNQVFYVETGLNKEFEDYIRSNYFELRRLFSSHGLEFVFLPITAETLTSGEFKSAALYYMPWLKEEDLEPLREACHINIKDLFKELNLKDGEPALTNAKGKAFKLSVPSPQERFYRTIFDEIAYAYSGKVEEEGVHYRKMSDIRYSICEEHYEIDPELMQMFGRVVQTKPSWLVKTMLAKMMEKEEIISRLVITRQGRLYLPDYDLEILLKPKEKAFYFLYLKHPEGICFKDINDYKDELSWYYRRFTRRDDRRAIDAAIKAMADPTSGDADTQRSRIKSAINKAFTDKFCKECARYYTLEGSKGEAFKVLLPREKVIWELDI